MLRKSTFPLIASIVLFVACQDVFANQFVDSFRRGSDAEEAGNLDQAIADFSEAIKTYSHSAHAWAKRGECYLRKTIHSRQ